MMVSVWITTYNHEPYIAQAIDSVLMQQTNFDYNIIIGEDCSQDKTREIVLSYKNKYPQKIKLYLPEKNIGCNRMFQATYLLCKGKYIAWLDGDDYWSDPLKLQKQVDFLEANPDFVLCFHNVSILDKVNYSTYESEGPFEGSDGVYTLDNFLKTVNPIDAPTVLHRHILGDELPEWLFQLPFIDLGFYYLLLQYGKIKYINEKMAVYRMHKGGAWSGLSNYEQCRQMYLFFQTLASNLECFIKNKIFRNKVYNIIFSLRFSLLEMDVANKNYQRVYEHWYYILKHYKLLLFKFKKKRFIYTLLVISLNIIKIK